MASPEASTAASRLLVPTLVVGLMVGVFILIAWPTTGFEGGTQPRAPSIPTPRAEPGVKAGARAAARARPDARGDSSAGLDSSVTQRAEARAARLLRAWDDRRAVAWAAGDPSALSALYVPGASAGAADAAMLRDWRARGLAVEGLTTQLLEVRVLAHGPRHWVLRVRDRVSSAVAAGPGLTRSLPAGATAERRIELRRLGGAWLVASVRPVSRDGPARP